MHVLRKINHSLLPRHHVLSLRFFWNNNLDFSNIIKATETIMKKRLHDLEVSLHWYSLFLQLSSVLSCERSYIILIWIYSMLYSMQELLFFPTLYLTSINKGIHSQGIIFFFFTPHRLVFFYTIVLETHAQISIIWFTTHNHASLYLR